jgi:hypothetical protein
MLDTALARLNRAAGRRTILVCLVLFLVLNAVVLPVAATRLEAYSGGVGPLDNRVWGFSTADAFAALQAYGLEGRLFYFLVEVTADTLNPIVTLLFFSLALSYTLQRAFAPGHWIQRAPLVALAGAAADLLENAGLIVLLLTYPDRFSALAAATGLMTFVKWLLVFASMGLLLVAIGALVLRRRAGSAQV